MLDNEKQLTEFGIEPDISVSIIDSDLLGGKDTILEEAILYLLKMTEK